jgi:uncharacterized protein (TIGR02466 family)
MLEPFKDSELNFIKNTRKIYRQSKNSSYSENTYILDALELSSIKEFVLSCVNKCFKEIYDPKENIKLKITQSWANFASNGEFQVQHAHPNSFPFSGVLYVDADSAVDSICFHKNEALIPQFHINSNQLNTYTAHRCQLPVRTGNLFIFPSNLTHSVPLVTRENNQTRISIAFNTFFSGTIGDEVALTQLHLP